LANMRHGYYVADGAWLSNLASALATLRAPSVLKLILYENGKKFGCSGAQGMNKMAVSVKI